MPDLWMLHRVLKDWRAYLRREHLASILFMFSIRHACFATSSYKLSPKLCILCVWANPGNIFSGRWHFYPLFFCWMVWGVLKPTCALAETKSPPLFSYKRLLQCEDLLINGYVGKQAITKTSGQIYKKYETKHYNSQLDRGVSHGTLILGDIHFVIFLPIFVHSIKTVKYYDSYPFQTLKKRGFKLTNTSSTRSRIQPMSLLKGIKSTYINFKKQ